MEIIIYHEEYNESEPLENFIDLLHSSQMKYLASDLLQEGLSPRDIYEGIRRAMAAARAGGLAVRQHFVPLYTQAEGGLIRDCKLSKLGYALVLLNAGAKNPLVARWQLQLVRAFLKAS
jgi:hypothetical protein